MKKLATILLLGGIVLGSACSKSDDQPDPGPGGGGGTLTGTDLRGTITQNVTLTKDKTWRLRGYVYITNGATLTIEAGTKIVSNKDSAGVLLIYRGAKIQAEGTAAAPIVFTSNESNPQPGDLGGVVIVGQATGNGNHTVVEGGVDPAFSAFGGSNDADNSGVLKYVRIEYAGKAVNPNDEVNGLSLYGVGSGTTIDYVQVVRGLDDAFEFFGGTVNCKHLIAYNCADDDFDMDDGYRGKIQFGISIKDPNFLDTKTGGDVSNNLEVDNVNPSNGFLLSRAPITSPVLSNFTAIGPNNTTKADYGWGIRWRRGTKFVLANSVILGSQDGGLRVEQDSTVAYFFRDTTALYNSYIHALNNPVDFQTGLNIPGITYDNAAATTRTTTTYKSTVLAAAADAKLTDPFNNGTPNVKPAAGSVLLTGALFDRTKLTDAFFEKVAYKGAFDGTTDWTTGWTIWNK